MTATALTIALSILQREEGLRLDPYQCTAGKWTCWYGRNYQDKPLTTDEQTRLLRMGNTEEFAAWLLEREIGQIDQALAVQPWYARQNPARQAALICMGYQMGLDGLRGFRATLGALLRAEFEQAAGHMLNSLWAEQTPARAKRMAEIIKTGEAPA